MGSQSGSGVPGTNDLLIVRLTREGQAVAIPVEVTQGELTEAGWAGRAKTIGVSQQLVGLDEKGRFRVREISYPPLSLDPEKALEAWNKLTAIGVIGGFPGDRAPR